MALIGFWRKISVLPHSQKYCAARCLSELICHVEPETKDLPCLLRLALLMIVFPNSESLRDPSHTS